MGADHGRKPLLPGRGFLRIEEFCRSTGLERVAVENLIRTGRLDGVLWSDEKQTRAFGIFEDELPSRATLAAMGLPVRDDYEPDALRSCDVTDDDDSDVV